MRGTFLSRSLRLSSSILVLSMLISALHARLARSQSHKSPLVNWSRCGWIQGARGAGEEDREEDGRGDFASKTLRRGGGGRIGVPGWANPAHDAELGDEERVEDGGEEFDGATDERGDERDWSSLAVELGRGLGLVEIRVGVR